MAGKTLKMEACFERLEQIVALMESGDIPLEETVSLYEEGMALMKRCAGTLTEMKNKVMILREKNGTMVEEPMETEGMAGDDLEPMP